MFSSKLRSTRLIVFDLRKFSPFSESEINITLSKVNSLTGISLKSENDRFTLEQKLRLWPPLFGRFKKLKSMSINKVYFLAIKLPSTPILVHFEKLPNGGSQPGDF